ncbi:hypothetical protein L1887_18016 [Cichorium endivia]|nr:hypothetical protein L1887_18016 [Cichorium endivia]
MASLLSARMDRVESFSLGHCVDARLLLALCFTSILVKPPHAFLLIYANFLGCMWCYRAPAPHLNDFLGLDHQVNDRFSCAEINKTKDIGEKVGFRLQGFEEVLRQEIEGEGGCGKSK